MCVRALRRFGAGVLRLLLVTSGVAASVQMLGRRVQQANALCLQMTDTYFQIRDGRALALSDADVVYQVACNTFC